MFPSKSVARACLAVALATTTGILAWAGDPPPGGTRLGPPRFDGGDVLFDWDSGGDLQVAPTPAGPWTTVKAPQNRSSNARLPALRDGHNFFRIVDHGVAGAPQPIVGGDPLKPYAVRRATVRKAATPLGNALVEAELVPGQNPPAAFPLLLGGSVLQLHDDGRDGDAVAGDGTYTGALTLDAGEFQESNAFLDAIGKTLGVLGTFDGRSAVGARRPAFFDAEAFQRGDRVQVFPSPFDPVPAATPGARSTRAAAPAGTAPILAELCVTNVAVVPILRTNLVVDPVVGVTNVVVGFVKREVTTNLFQTNIVFVPDGIPLTNVTAKTVVIGVIDVPITEPRPVTNLVSREVVVTVDGLVTNIDCKPIIVDGGGGGGTGGGGTTNIDVLLNRPGFAGKALLVTDLSVVEDPRRTFDPCTGRGTKMGAWTFGRLMADLCNQPATGIEPGDFARRWLRSWQQDQTINFDSVTNRNPEIVTKVIDAWEAASGGPDKPLDLSIAPFRLLAIVNRVDLRGNPGYGGGASSDACNPTCVGGEGRFVFCLIEDAFKGGTGGTGGTGGVDPGGTGAQGGGYGGGGGGGGTNACAPSQFTVIFEYCVPKRTCAEIKDWGLQWYALAQLEFGPGFNDALQRITDQFAAAGADPSRQPNLSALNQLRANELLREPWDLREWRLFPTDSDRGQLREVTVKQTPASRHNLTPIIAEYCLANAGDVLAEKHVVPLEWRTPGKPRVPFLGGDAPMATAGFFWDGPAPSGSSLATPLRHKFSLNTCNGCHAGETGTPFTHVFPRAAGEEARLSDFLTGRNMPKIDPADHATPHVFADLKRREDDLLRLVGEPCFLQVLRTPNLFTH